MVSPTITDYHNANNVPENNVDKKSTGSGLAQWIMDKVQNSRDSRDNQYKERWDAYERTFRGFHSKQDRTREGERSKLIAPALLQAIDSTAATIEDAIFSRAQWFTAIDDVMDEQREDVSAARDNLTEDLDTAGVPDAISKIILNGCLYGTGIGKINVIRKEMRTIIKDQGGNKVVKTLRPLITLEPIPPWEYVIDSQARTQADALFEAHETHVPKNVVWNKIKRKIYRNVPIQNFSPTKLPRPGGEQSVDLTYAHNAIDGSVWVTEYYGLVPYQLAKQYSTFKKEDLLGNGMVEVIVTIANEQEILRVMPNPFYMKDRPIIVYQHDIVPGKFWGRGIAEKGWNAQRALDAELRARMDALGLLTSPMMGADVTRLPRNPDMRVRPGKVWLTRGRPSEVLEPVILGNLDPNTFNQSSEMERLVQVATGSIESNAPLNNDRRNETASGISMIQSSALKRMKRTMWNIERQFLNPLIRKSMWRLMQFNPDRYPEDMEFVVKGTMGIVAREFEQSSLVALLSVVPPESPAWMALLKGVVELSGTPKRDELLKTLEKMSQPDPEQEKLKQQQMQQSIEGAQVAIDKDKKEIEKLDAEIANIKAKTEHEKVNTDLEDEKIDIQAANAVIGREKAKAAHKANENAARKIEVDAKRPKPASKG